MPIFNQRPPHTITPNECEDAEETLAIAVGNCRYPNITVTLSGLDGNTLNLIGAVNRAFKKHGIDKEEIQAFTTECFAAPSYDHLLDSITRWVTVE